MAVLDYQRRLRNLETRRFDSGLNEMAISPSFRATTAPENIRYLFESMTPIEPRYNNRTIEAAGRVRKHLEENLTVHFTRAYRTQGSVETKTNIRVHSDFDLLAIVDAYHFEETSSGNPWTKSVPEDDIREFRKQATSILNGLYDQVDTSNAKCVSVFNKSLNRKVDVVFACWYNTDDYNRTGDEYYRGVYLYKSPTWQAERDYPFAHMHQVNIKGNTTADGSRRAIRLLKTLKADCVTNLHDLKSFHLTTAVHSMEDAGLNHNGTNDLEIAVETSTQLQRITNDAQFRKTIKSPNGVEHPLESDALVPLLIRLKKDLDNLIDDVAREWNSQAARDAEKAYRSQTLL